MKTADQELKKQFIQKNTNFKTSTTPAPSSRKGAKSKPWKGKSYISINTNLKFIMKAETIRIFSLHKIIGRPTSRSKHTKDNLMMWGITKMKYNLEPTLLINNALTKLYKYVDLASEIFHHITPPPHPVHVNNVKEKTPNIIMNTIMAW